MKYKKGTFVVIPNKQYLKGKPSEMQSIYFWLCEHADDTGGCYPTKDTISDEAGCSHNTTDKYLKQLEDEGFLKITPRRKKGSMEFTSNHYQVLILSHNPNVVQPTPIIGITPPPKIGSETNPSINEPNLRVESVNTEVVIKKKTKKQIREESPFIFKEELEALWNSGWKPKKIIYNYFVRKNIVHENVKQFDSAVARYLRPAQALEGYSSKQIESVMDYLDSKKLSWTLETISKNISEVVNRK